MRDRCANKREMLSVCGAYTNRVEQSAQVLVGERFRRELTILSHLHHHNRLPHRQTGMLKSTHDGAPRGGTLQNLAGPSCPDPLHYNRPEQHWGAEPLGTGTRIGGRVWHNLACR
jgi:hypothetical protein